MLRIRLSLVVLVVTLSLSGSTMAAQAFAYGLGMSAKADPAAAGDEAAAQAKAMLGNVTPKVVIVGAAEKQMVPALVDAIAKYFDRSIIYGLVSSSPLLPMGNFADVKAVEVDAGVGICVVGGDVDIAVEVQETDADADDGYYEAGLALGQRMKPILEASTRPGKVILSAGDQLNTVNQDFVAGLLDGWEHNYLIVGGASGNHAMLEIVKGEIRNGVNICVALMGDFGVGMSMFTGSHTPEATRTAVEMALKDGQEYGKPFFAIISNCKSRRQGMLKSGGLDQELEYIKQTLKTDFYGNYVHGEIGCRGKDAPAEGVGFSISIAVLFELK